MPRKSSHSRYQLTKSDLALWVSSGLGLLLLILTLGWEGGQLVLYTVFIVLSVEGILDLLNWLQRDDYLPSILLVWALAAIAMAVWLYSRGEILLLVAIFGIGPWLAIVVLGTSRAYRSYLHWSAGKGRPRAQYRLAELYYYGQGVKEDLQAAVHWYRPGCPKALLKGGT